MFCDTNFANFLIILATSSTKEGETQNESKQTGSTSAPLTAAPSSGSQKELALIQSDDRKYP